MPASQEVGTLQLAMMVVGCWLLARPPRSGDHRIVAFDPVSTNR